MQLNRYNLCIVDNHEIVLTHEGVSRALFYRLHIITSGNRIRSKELAQWELGTVRGSGMFDTFVDVHFQNEYLHRLRQACRALNAYADDKDVWWNAAYGDEASRVGLILLDTHSWKIRYDTFLLTDVAPRRVLHFPRRKWA